MFSNVGKKDQYCLKIEELELFFPRNEHGALQDVKNTPDWLHNASDHNVSELR